MPSALVGKIKLESAGLGSRTLEALLTKVNVGVWDEVMK